MRPVQLVSGLQTKVYPALQLQITEGVMWWVNQSLAWSNTSNVILVIVTVKVICV